MDSIKSWFISHEWLTLIVLALIFVSVRLPGTDLPLHQDEYKWPLSVNPALHVSVFIPHPPIGELIYRTAGYVVGFNVNFRFVPLFFGTLNLLLLYYFMRSFFSRRHAVVASLVWIGSYFSVLASLMVDTDGQIMPFFFLLALIAYSKISTEGIEKKMWWGTLLVCACILGFLVKVSFILAIAAFIADFLWSKRNLISKKDLLRYVFFGVGGFVGLSLLLFLMKFIFPFFQFSRSLAYWEHFAAGNRNWFQTGIQCVKAILYASPLLVVVPLFGIQGWSKSISSYLRPFLFFLSFAFIFYVILFDFSIGALDRYLQLLILPLTALATYTIVPILENSDRRTKEYCLLGGIIGLILLVVQFVPHFVPPLHPKTEWVSRFLSLRWNFVYPFSGGSGPLGFYVSFLGMMLSWIISLALLVIAQFKPQMKKMLLVLVLVISVFYNGVFIEEYLFGGIHGSAPKLLVHAVEYIKNHPEITSVTVYNDNGGDEIRATGKYYSRLYVDPMFNITEKVDALNRGKMHYFVLNVPRLNPDSVYVKYFNTCEVAYQEFDQKISATVYDCRNAPDVHIEN